MRTKYWGLACLLSSIGLLAACAPIPDSPPNLAPVSVITATPESGSAPLEVAYSAAGSVDHDGEIVAYNWEFGDGSGGAQGVDVTHTYEHQGTYTATLTVKDDSGVSGSTNVGITVLPPPPATLASDEPINLNLVGDPIAVSNTGDWDVWELREPGAPIYDPVTDSWICTYTGRGNTVEGNSAVTASIGAVISRDGEVWEPHPQNPLTGAGALGGVGQGEDPYIAKDATTGHVWRDSSGRALMFTEEKDFAMHRGVAMWRSASNTLSDWTLFGQVVDRGAVGTWDATDRTSPTVIHDGARLVMLFEGRNLPAGQDGAIGIAYSTDEGETWAVSRDPFVAGGDGGIWNDNSVVPDDLVKIGESWVLLAHGQDAGAIWSAGRYLTTDHPTDWTAGSFVELPGNPLTYYSNTVMSWGDDPSQVVQVLYGTTLQRAVVERR